MTCLCIARSIFFKESASGWGGERERERKREKELSISSKVNQQFKTQAKKIGGEKSEAAMRKPNYQLLCIQQHQSQLNKQQSMSCFGSFFLQFGPKN